VGDATEITLAILKALVTSAPAFAAWLSGLLDGEPTPSDFSRRVRDILPERSASRDAAEKLGPEDA